MQCYQVVPTVAGSLRDAVQLLRRDTRLRAGGIPAIANGGTVEAARLRLVPDLEDREALDPPVHGPPRHGGTRPQAKECAADGRDDRDPALPAVLLTRVDQRDAANLVGVVIDEPDARVHGHDIARDRRGLDELGAIELVGQELDERFAAPRPEGFDHARQPLIVPARHVDGG